MCTIHDFKYIVSFAAFAICLPFLQSDALAQKKLDKSVLQGKVICLDPGHGGTADTDHYRVGPSGEREEWVNLRVGLYLKKLLEKEGAKVLMTREEDVQVVLADRAVMAMENQADVFISIHHNATADRTVNFPIIYFHGSSNENQASVLLGRLVGEEFRKGLFANEGPISLVSDFTVFPTAGASVLRGTYGTPAVLAEASFFSNAAEEARLKKKSYNRKEAKAYLTALTRYFSHDQLAIKEKKQPAEIPPFPVFQEAERMNPEAKKWGENFNEGKKILENGQSEHYEEALRLLTLSVKSFPDSYLAGEGHLLRSEVLEKLGRKEEADQEKRRYQYFYVEMETADQ